jgi:hypothetical protein
MNDFNITLTGNETNLHQTVVLLDPLIGQINVAFGTTDDYLAANSGDLMNGFAQMAPEGESAIHQKDANGNYLRQYLVIDPACDQINKTYDPQCGNGTPNPERQPSSSTSSGSSPSSGTASSPSPNPGGSGGGGGPGATPPPTPAPKPSCDPLLQLLGRC